MLRSILDKLSTLLGHNAPQGPSRSMAQAPARTPGKPLVKQVYEGKPSETPEFAQGVDTSQLIRACTKQSVCKFTPHIEFKRIYTTRKGPNGNLETEYEGIAGDCGAVKNFGLNVAKQDGYLQTYRYVDLNHIFNCCCGNPEQCVFFKEALNEHKSLNRNIKKL